MIALHFGTACAIRSILLLLQLSILMDYLDPFESGFMPGSRIKMHWFAFGWSPMGMSHEWYPCPWHLSSLWYHQSGILLHQFWLCYPFGSALWDGSEKAQYLPHTSPSYGTNTSYHLHEVIRWDNPLPYLSSILMILSYTSLLLN